MFNNSTIKEITLTDCLPLRHKVLWPLLTIEECIDPADKDSIHMGYILNDTLISCLTLTPQSMHHCQIRKFATDPAFQRRGIGSTLFTTTLNKLKKNHIKLVTLNARNTAIGFYHKFNFQISGKEFSKKNVLFTPMEINLENLSKIAQ